MGDGIAAVEQDVRQARSIKQFAEATAQGGMAAASQWSEQARARSAFQASAAGRGMAGSQASELVNAYRTLKTAAAGDSMAAAAHARELGCASRTFATDAFAKDMSVKAALATKGGLTRAREFANQCRAFTKATLATAASAIMGDLRRSTGRSSPEVAGAARTLSSDAMHMVNTLPSYVEPKPWDPNRTYHPGEQVVEDGNVYQVPCSGVTHRGVGPGADDSGWWYAGTLDNNRERYIEQFLEACATA